MKKKALFIDRDGTIVVEPPVDYQVDSLEKLEFLPGVFKNLFFIRKNLDFEFVMVSNQDGLGTPVYPLESFNLVQDKILTALKNEDIIFDDILIDKSLPGDNLPTRKPGTGMLKRYMESGDYDLDSSYVIGDRITDIELAKNLGAKGILIADKNIARELEKSGLDEYCSLVTLDWSDIYTFLLNENRRAAVRRTTGETDINIEIVLIGSGQSKIDTGLGFFDHMLDQIARHGNLDLYISVKGDLHVDEHHTVEDTAIVLGEAFNKAIGNKKGMERYGFALPMDDASATVLIDFGGRPWTVWETSFAREKIGDVPTELFFHFFKSFSDGARCNLNIKAEGENEHHKIEAIFKCFARAIKQAVRRDPWSFSLPSTKGVL
ncbi:MAG: bifunctional histidinol-phosphatase/imidazoleglycerol-phosphate dehydratase HisB [Bacteroidota bacterium]